MSDASDGARVQVFIADHAVADASNKVNALGVGFQWTATQPGGFTAPQSIVALIDFPLAVAGQEAAVELALYDDANQLVMSPSMTGAEGTAIRFAQNVTISTERTQVPGLRFPVNAIRPRFQVIAAFPQGVACAVGVAYEWRVAIDGDTRPDWSVGFYVPAPAAGLVIG